MSDAGGKLKIAKKSLRLSIWKWGKVLIESQELAQI